MEGIHLGWLLSTNEPIPYAHFTMKTSNILQTWSAPLHNIINMSPPPAIIILLPSPNPPVGIKFAEIHHFHCNIHHASKKYTYIFSSVSVKFEPISIKIGMHVLEETLNKTAKMTISPPKICFSTTLGNVKWKFEPSMQYLHVHFNESLNSHKTNGSAILKNRQTCS